MEYEAESMNPHNPLNMNATMRKAIADEGFVINYDYPLGSGVTGEAYRATRRVKVLCSIR